MLSKPLGDLGEGVFQVANVQVFQISFEVLSPVGHTGDLSHDLQSCISLAFVNIAISRHDRNDGMPHGIREAVVWHVVKWR